MKFSMIIISSLRTKIISNTTTLSSQVENKIHEFRSEISNLLNTVIDVTGFICKFIYQPFKKYTSKSFLLTFRDASFPLFISGEL
ncbi:TPA: hypothetical protein ACK8S9_002820 [Legionella pneumophila]|nr:hypothetical protein [Legionella pneumophila]HEM7014016.1 hypothetical protein [Legionella pneumophila]